MHPADLRCDRYRAAQHLPGCRQRADDGLAGPLRLYGAVRAYRCHRRVAADPLTHIGEPSFVLLQLQLLRRGRLLLCHGKRQLAGVQHQTAGCAFAHRDGTGGLFAALIAGRDGRSALGMAGHLAGAVHRCHCRIAGSPDQKEVVVGCLHIQVGHRGRVSFGDIQRQLGSVQCHAAVRQRLLLRSIGRQRPGHKQFCAQHHCTNTRFEPLLHGLCPPRLLCCKIL